MAPLIWIPTRVQAESLGADSPGNIRVSRLFLVTTDGAKRRPVLRTRKTDDVE